MRCRSIWQCNRWISQIACEPANATTESFPVAQAPETGRSGEGRMRCERRGTEAGVRRRDWTGAGATERLERALAIDAPELCGGRAGGIGVFFFKQKTAYEI